MRLLLTVPIACLGLAACSSTTTPAPSSSTSGTGSGAGATVTVSSTDTQCKLSAVTAPAGDITFTITNDGGQITEFYVLGADKQKIVGEVEDIGPGTTRDLSISTTAGTYYTNCKPGMSGDGITAAFTVTG